ncbi:UNVERIFIED_CONTAM: hypothetical protein Sradi_0210500 [Sesamum radiatum]|uniref:Retrotransposon gag domain-containing protein n=1 Tax=Sesamum radiatum TaxID=300843 RepID=A0AAW2W483_SESRA
MAVDLGREGAGGRVWRWGRRKEEGEGGGGGGGGFGHRDGGGGNGGRGRRRRRIWERGRRKEEGEVAAATPQRWWKHGSGGSSLNTVNEAIAKTYEIRVQAFKSHVKPYTRRIEQLRMPENYQPPKFQQFDGHEDPRQHIAHFVEICNNAGTDGDLLVKQFVLYLKDAAFDWYIDIEANSIDSWDDLQNKFFSHFYNARCIVSMTELANQHPEKDEPVLDYINNWRNLSLSCKDALSEISAVELCIQGMHWELCYILQAIKPKTFGELATRAHGIEMSFKCKENNI